MYNWVPFWPQNRRSQRRSSSIFSTSPSSRSAALSWRRCSDDAGVLRPLSPGQQRLARQSGAEKPGTGRSAGPRPPWCCSWCSSSGAPRSTSGSTVAAAATSRSTSSASNGCGRWSIPAASARSTRCTCRSDKTVRLVLASQDVIHSFFIPAFRIKHDVVPGQLRDDVVQGRRRPANSSSSARSFAAPQHAHMRGRSSSWSRPPMRAG